MTKALPHSQRRTLKALRHMPALTDRALGYRQVQVMVFIHEIAILTGLAPSYADIERKFGIDRSNLSRLITGLERRGLLSRVGAGRVRRIRLPL